MYSDTANKLMRFCPNCKAELTPMMFGVGRYGCKSCGLLVTITSVAIDEVIAAAAPRKP